MLIPILLVVQLVTSLIALSTCIGVHSAGLNSEVKSGCSIFKHLGANDLSINDIVVKSSVTNVACIKARFSLAMKVEAVIEEPKAASQTNNTTAGEQQPPSSNPSENDYSRIVLGYLPLDSVVGVEDSCPAPPITPPEDGQTVKEELENRSNDTISDPGLQDAKELEMVIAFECGKFVFNFQRDENFYVSSIVGVVNLDSNTNRSFVAEKPMFFTSDLTHHFKFNELIEVDSVVETKAYILTANFYNSEFEVFRNTSSRDFIRPPDDQSKPFLQ